MTTKVIRMLLMKSFEALIDNYWEFQALKRLNMMRRGTKSLLLIRERNDQPQLFI
jgi:hypothetical protein